MGFITIFHHHFGAIFFQKPPKTSKNTGVLKERGTFHQRSLIFSASLRIVFLEPFRESHRFGSSQGSLGTFTWSSTIRSQGEVWWWSEQWKRATGCLGVFFWRWNPNPVMWDLRISHEIKSLIKQPAQRKVRVFFFFEVTKWWSSGQVEFSKERYSNKAHGNYSRPKNEGLTKTET